MNLSTLPTDATGQLDVLGHDGDSLGVDGAQVGVLEQTDQVSLAGLLKSHDGRALEAQVGLEVLSDLSDQTLEGQLADQQLSGLLVTTDLSQSHGTGPVTMGLLHATGGWGAFAGSLGSELLPWGFASGGFTSGLLGSCHCEQCSEVLTQYCAMALYSFQTWLASSDWVIVLSVLKSNWPGLTISVLSQPLQQERETASFLTFKL